jgi:hypothetical protein
VQLLYWLPLVFLVWANCHIQFIYGLFVVGLFAAVHLLQQRGVRVGIAPDFASRSSLPAGKVLLISAACGLATCLGPYTYHLYPVVFAYAGSKFPYIFIREFRALTFRAFSHYVELLLAGAAFFTLGRQKRVDLFKLALLTVASVVAFRTMRDSWFLCMAAAALIAGSWPQDVEREGNETWPEKAALAAALALVTPDRPQHRLQHARSGRCHEQRVSHQSRQLSSPKPPAGAALQHFRLGRLSHLVHARLSCGD